MTARSVRCIDNTLARDVLAVGRVYEVLPNPVLERDGYLVLSGLGAFSAGRFEPVREEEGAK